MTDHYCECCFAPVTPLTINTTHRCDPKIKAAREKERDEANEEINNMADIQTCDMCHLVKLELGEHVCVCNKCLWETCTGTEF